jgi:hypothetical protein
MRDTPVSPEPCLNCGKLLDAAAHEDARPAAGDWTICLYCAHMMVFRDDLSLRSPSAAELAEMAGEPEVVRKLGLVRNAHNQRSKNVS